MAEDKQLPASAKRRGELRLKGQVPRSQDLVTVGQVGVGLFGLLLIGPTIGEGLSNVMSSSFKQIQLQPGINGPSPLSGSWEWGLYVLGFFATLFLTAIVSQVAQVGLVLADEALEPDLTRLNPIAGLQKLFTLRRAVTTIQALIKLVVVVLFAVAAGRDLLNADVFMRPVTVLELGNFLTTIAWSIGWRILLAAFIIAAVDYIYQRWQFEKDHRMSPDEMKDEVRQQEGSPEIKKKRMQIMRRTSLRRMLEDMKDNTIVITNPTHYAVALRYKRGEMPVPIIMGKGMRLIAKRLKEEAMSCRVPIIENPPLARGLYKYGRVGEPIPTLYYQAVAAILAQLFRRGYRAGDAPEGFYGMGQNPADPNNPSPTSTEGTEGLTS
jgi:flagellar biosynthetic protein FlhB